ncbi:MAG: potassium-transporting ATPase ATP-binding subunit, partial [Nocardioidaceae bacterium]|nr:potassium-transporting ATPase ATP-binding subunit [Nocardioidaceae bacterium]
MNAPSTVAPAPVPSVLTPAQITEALPGALRKLDPRALLATPVMLVVEIGAVVTTVLSIKDPSTMGWMVTVWLWLTVLFGTLAESVAEGRGKAQAASLRTLQQETTARKVRGSSDQLKYTGNLADLPTDDVASTSLHAGDVVVVVAGERIPGDGDVIEGV